MIITYNKYTFRIRPKDKIYLPEYKGSTFRGGFGVAFKRVVCALKKNDCADCILNKNCIYSYVFESFAFDRICKIFNDTFSKDIPRPFIIEPPLEKKREYNSDDMIEFNLILVGKAIEYLPYFVYSFEILGSDIGLGKGRGRFTVEKVLSEEGVIYKDGKLSKTNPKEFVLGIKDSKKEEYNGVLIEFLTPVRVVEGRRLVKNISFSTFFKALHRRLILLAYYHCGVEEANYDYRSLIDMANGVKTVEQNLTWYDWERYSKRKDTRMNLGGYVGSIVFEGNLSLFLDFIKAGEILHIGKGAVFGMGKYALSLI